MNSLYDICIIGTGPAGMTLASELAGSNKKICVLESGGLKKNKYADSLKEIESFGDIKIKASSRERVLGGTSTTWAGLSSPLDEIDLVHWPINFADLKPYYIKAGKYGFAPFEEFFKKVEDEDIKIPDGKFEKKGFIASDPAWNFSQKLKHIFDKGNIELKLDSTVVGFNKENNEIKEAITIDSKRTESRIRAEVFVLATGGLESARLLLNSDIGNEYDQVGRYIMNHPKNNYGIVKLSKPVKNASSFFGYLENGWAHCAGIHFNQQTQKSLGLLNSYIRLEPIFPWTDNKGVASLIGLTKQAKFFLDWWKRQQKKLVNLRDWNETGDDKPEVKSTKKFNIFSAVVLILMNIPAVASYSIHRLFPKKELPVRTLRLRNFMEMEPLAENRLTLGNKLDANGQRVPVITSHISQLDRRSLIELHKIFGQEIEKANIGKLESNIANEKVRPITADASHHLGGTIMGNDPKTSVVDKNLRVHSTSNLYITSGSVFPTSGCANPTYTICALSIRLAEHLKNTV